MDVTWKNIRLIFLREVRDQLRDRRTLFMVLVLPLLLYPGLGVGMLNMALYFTEQPRQVVILGADNLPEPALISDGRIAGEWFRDPATAEKLNVLTDSKTLGGRITVTQSSTSDDMDNLLKAARELKVAVDRRNALAQQLAPWDSRLIDELPDVQSARLRAAMAAGDLPPRPADYETWKQEFETLRREIGEKFAASRIQVLVLIPDGFGDNVRRINELLSQGRLDEELRGIPLMRPIVIRNRADQKSDVAFVRIADAMARWENRLLLNRLESSGLPETVPDPVNTLSIDVASEDEIAASVWSRIFPSLLIIMALTGAFYPAIDVAAGEKERGTMETLLICPASRSEIVIGKFLTVMLFSVTTTLLNLASMGLTSQYIVSATGNAAGSMMADVPLPTPMAMCWLFVLLMPLAAFFSALSLALATFARSNKEGQYYLTPLFMVTMGVTMFAMAPSVELSTTGGTSLFYCVMPIAGPALLLKALLNNPNDTGILVFALPVLMSSIGYSLITLWWAVEQFKSEDVLFRESERFELKAWLRHLLRDKEPLPTFTEAAFCFVLMMLLQFLTISFAGALISGVTKENFGERILVVAVVQQISLIATPALLMAMLLTSGFRQTLRLNWPTWRMLGMALILPVVLHPLAVELLASLKHVFPQLPESARQTFAAMADPNLPMAAIFATFALTPAICEEVAFRGFILSGFGRGGRVGVSIVLSSLTFGIIHMIPQQVFNATLLGLVLGLLAVRSNSLLPGVIFHLCFNALGVIHSQATAAWLESPPTWLGDGVLSWWVGIDEEQVRYQLPTLLLCAAIAFVLIRMLINQRSAPDTTELPVSMQHSMMPG